MSAMYNPTPSNAPRSGLPPAPGVSGTPAAGSGTARVGDMQNLNPARIIARRGRDVMLVGALLLLAGLVGAAFGLLVLIAFGTNPVGIVIVVLGLVILVIGMGFIVRGLTYRKDNEEARIVGDALARELGERYVYIRNLSRRGLGYIDAVLLGPPGALVFRITDTPGIFLNEGADWLERKGGQNFALSGKQFTRECVTDIYALRDYLGKHAIDVPVYGVVIFTNPQAQVSTRQPVVPVTELRNLMVVLRRDYLAQENRIKDDLVKAAQNAVYN